MKLLAVVLATALLAGCGDPPPVKPKVLPEDKAKLMQSYSLRNVKGLEDCVYFKVDVPGTYLHVVRCPNSTSN